ncbi:hypothetical protein HD554DRAFT_243413 [Boletus coccyginus]|nr:hypothetical protein HD554DRAFT_243413 [Boletus coccyginus]
MDARYLVVVSLSTPILAEPRPSPDFMKMDSLICPPPAEFVRNLNNPLYIASSCLSNVYIPGEATTRWYSRPISKNKGALSYQSCAKHLDLFAVPSTMGLIQQPPPSRTGHIQPVVPSPFVLGSNANLLFSQPVHPGVGGGSGSRTAFDEQSLESSAGLVPRVCRAAIVRVPVWVASAKTASRGSVRGQHTF